MSWKLNEAEKKIKIFLVPWTIFVFLLTLSHLREGSFVPDPDTAFIFTAEYAKISEAYFQHPMQWLWFTALPTLMQCGLSQQYAVRIIFALAFLIGIISISFLAFTLFKKWFPVFICVNVFALLPTTQNLLSITEDNILAYPTLLLSISVAISQNQERIKRIISLLLWGLSFHIAFWTLLWLPFILLLLLGTPFSFSKVEWIKNAFILTIYSIFSGFIFGVINDILLERAFFSFYNIDIMTASVEMNKLHQLRKIDGMSHYAFFQLTLADAFFGIFKIKGISPESIMRVSKYLSTIFILFHIGIIGWLMKINIKNYKARQTWYFIAFLLEFLGQVIFIYSLKDTAYMERFDFYPLLFPFLFYLLREQQETKFVSILLALLFSMIGMFYWINTSGFFI